MVILKMKLKGDKIHIKVSGGDVFTIPKNGLYELDIYEGMELEYEEIPHIRNKAFESAARKTAVSILKRGFISEGMLKDKMIKKGHKKTNYYISPFLTSNKEYMSYLLGKYEKVYYNTKNKLEKIKVYLLIRKIKKFL